MSSAHCVLLNSSFLFPATSKAELLKNFRGRNPVQYIHCTIQRNNLASYPLRILHSQVLWVLLSIWILSLRGGFSNNWHSCKAGGLVCLCIYLCVYVCLCVCVCVCVCLKRLGLAWQIPMVLSDLWDSSLGEASWLSWEDWRKEKKHHFDLFVF